jgi:cytochrome bd-type quinol oxidase subunit 2
VTTSSEPQQRRRASDLVRRPPELWAGAIFLTLAALPAAVFGVLLGLQPGNIGVNLRANIDNAHSTVRTDLLLNVFRAVGVVVLVLAVLFALFAWLAVQPRRGARSIAAALAVLEVVLLVVAMAISQVDPVSLGIVLLAVAGAVLMFLPRSQEFIAARS